MERERIFKGKAPAIGKGAIALFMVVVNVGCYEAGRVIQLRGVDVTGPIHQIPVRVTDGDAEGRLRVTPTFASMPGGSIDGRIEIERDSRLFDLHQYDTTNNLHWNLPSYVVGIALDYGTSKHFSFSLGANYSRTNEKKSYEWDFGLGWRFQDEYLGGRFEAGVQWQDIEYNAVFDRYKIDYSFSGSDVVQYLYTFNRYGRYAWGNFYGSLTLNTVFRGSSLNGFVRAGYGVTSVLSNEMLRANEDGDIAATVGMINVTPGLFINLTKWSRLVVGCELISPVTMNSYSPEWLIVPVAQIDFTI